jgi:hypothetical protein
MANRAATIGTTQTTSHRCGSAHYEQEPDAIVIFDAKDLGTVSRVVGYTEFCQKVLDLFAAFELAVRFHHDIYIHLEGRFA